MSEIVTSLPDEGPCMQIFSDTNNSIQSHGPPVTNMPPKPSTDGKPKMTINWHLKWEPGTKLTVKFLDDPAPASDFVKNKIKQYAEQWKEFANIDFDWLKDNTKDATVRIAFRKQGYWSGVGKDIKARENQAEPTMNLQFTDATSEETFQRKTLHEFGHTLGLVHEQTSPKIKFTWKADVVIADMAKPPNKWDEEKVRHNFHNFTPIGDPNSAEGKWFRATDEWDGESIMQYDLKETWTSLGKPVRAMNVLSKSDKEFIKVWYPKDVKKAP